MMTSREAGSSPTALISMPLKTSDQGFVSHADNHTFRFGKSTRSACVCTSISTNWMPIQTTVVPPHCNPVLSHQPKTGH